MTELWNRLRDFFRRDRLERELDEELRFHRSQLARDERIWRRRFGADSNVVGTTITLDGGTFHDAAQSKRSALKRHRT